MRGRGKRLPVFIGFLLLSLLVFSLSQLGLLDSFNSLIQSIIRPIQISSNSLFHIDDSHELTKLKNENREMRTELVKLKVLENDNRAFRDQFAISKPAPSSLLPAYIVSSPTFLPGITQVDKITIDRGSSDNIKPGNLVVYKENLIGKVEKVSSSISVVELLNHKNIFFTAQTIKTGATGIIKGTGEKNMVLDNVLLTDTLKKGDTVVMNDSKMLVFGRIISITKRASSLFQTAEVESLYDLNNLEMVFVMVGD